MPTRHVEEIEDVLGPNGLTEASVRSEPSLAVRKQRGVPFKPRRGTRPVSMLPDRYLDRLLAISVLMDAEFAKPVPDEHVLETMSREVAAIEQLAVVIGDVPFRESAAIDPQIRLAAHLLFGASSAVPPAMTTPLARARLFALFKTTLGVPIERAWALPFVSEVESACLRNQNARRRRYLPAEYQGQFPVEEDPVTQARSVLERSRERMASWPLILEIPAAVDIALTMYFVARYGFENGGGAKRTISRSRLLHLLGHPRELIRDLQKAPAGAARWKAVIAALTRDAEAPHAQHLR